MSNRAISVSGISKSYTVWRSNPPRPVIALNDLSFQVNAGERLAIIGSNGSGKSTLLGILSGLIKPTAGTAEIHGRVSSILDTGANFHPDLSGEENARMFFRIAGLKSAAISSLLAETREFSGLDEAFFQPVKTYSKGMALRLAFTTAYLQQADVYLIDEVLSVGDEAFRAKVDWVMEKLIRQKKTMLFATHNRQEVAALSTRCLWIEKGVLTMDDIPARIIPKYSRFQQVRFEEETKELKDVKKIWTPEKGKQGIDLVLEDSFQNEYLKLTRISIQQRQQMDHIVREEDICISIEMEKKQAGVTFSALLKIRDDFGQPVIHALSLLNTTGISEEDAFISYTGRLSYTMTIPANMITSGNYFLSLWFGKNIDKNQPHFSERAFYLPHEIQFTVSNIRPEFLSEPLHFSVQPALPWSVQSIE